MERFVIIDGHAILYRAYHALPPLTTSGGELVNAVFGFCSMLFKIRDELKPSFFAVSFDLPKPTFRQKLFKTYQAQRPKMADELAGQIEKVKNLVRTLGIPIFEMEGYEADDVIGTLVKQTKQKKDLETIVVTGDKDILQLVDKKTKVYILVKGLSEAVIFDAEKVKEKLGISPEQIPDYKGLVGDSSDNYPGVSGIGPKTAVELLLEYGNFGKIYKNLSKIPEKTSQKLREGKADGEMSFKLATIVQNVPVNLEIKKCRIRTFDLPEVRKLLGEFGFRTLISRLNGRVDVNNEKGNQTKSKNTNNSNQMGLF